MELKAKIETPTESYVCHYPAAVNTAVDQMAIFWPAEELGVEEDEADVRTKLTAGEREGLTTLQSILTQYELMIGGTEMWGGRIAALFPRPEIQRACAVISMVELNSHAPFYDLINKCMDNATDEFYLEWKRDPILSQHIEWIDEKASAGDALEATAALAFLEGVMLFSAFAFFKAFNSRGFNMIPHFVAGIDGSAKDENFHSMFSAYLFRTCLEERVELGIEDDDSKVALSILINQMAEQVLQHEYTIIDKIFAGNADSIRVVTKEEMRHFIRDRVNIVLGRLGLDPMFNQENGVISQWFYQSLSTFKYSDFFASTQLQYTRNWAKHKLTFRNPTGRDLSHLLKEAS